MRNLSVICRKDTTSINSTLTIMGSIRKIMAALLACFAMAASLPDVQAQTRRATSESQNRKSSGVQQKRDMKPSDKKPSVKPDNKPAPKPEAKPAPKPNRKPVPKPEAKPAPKPGQKPAPKPGNGPGMKPGNGPAPGKPGNVRPDHKPDKPAYHAPRPEHRPKPRPDRRYGHRVNVLPSRIHKHIYHGVTYYVYDNVWYRPYSGYYVVCRPPYGVSLAAEIISDIAWTAAYMARVNPAPVVELGLVQNRLSADEEYFYDDGLFLVKNSDGGYTVIVPPAGALVEALPEDYETVILKDGKEYYKVEDTIYRMSIYDGKPYFEVLGQKY